MANAQRRTAPQPSISPARDPDGGTGAAGGVATLFSAKLRRPRTPRYVRLLRASRFVLPVIAGALVIAAMVWPQLQPRVDRFRMGTASQHGAEESDPSIVTARYEGINRDGRPFAITSETVTDLDREGNLVALDNPQGDMTLKSGAWMALSASDGIYDRTTDSLELNGDVNLTHDSGYDFRTSQATIDLAAGTAAGTKPVQGHGPLGEITSEGFHTADNGKTVFFDGRAKMLIYPNATAAEQ